MRCARPSTIAGLADAGLADQHRVVLRAARQHLDHAADLLVAPDHRVELALLGGLGQVAAELRQRLVGALGILRRDALAAAHLLQRAEQRLARDEVEREQEVLDRDEVVVELPRLVEGVVQHLAEGRRLPVAAAFEPETAGSARRRASASARIELGSAPARWSSVRGSSCSSSATVRWSRVSSGLPARRASSCAPGDGLAWT